MGYGKGTSWIVVNAVGKREAWRSKKKGKNEEGGKEDRRGVQK